MSVIVVFLRPLGLRLGCFDNFVISKHGDEDEGFSLRREIYRVRYERLGKIERSAEALQAGYNEFSRWNPFHLVAGLYLSLSHNSYPPIG